MELQKLAATFAVCKLPHPQSADITRPLTFLSVTEDEVSLVCESSRVPPDATHVEDGWRALKISGQLDFGMVGVIAGISAVLARSSISLFVVSTYNTDYILIKQDAFAKAEGLLVQAGYRVVSPG